MADGSPLILGYYNQSSTTTTLNQAAGGFYALSLSGDSGVIAESWSESGVGVAGGSAGPYGVGVLGWGSYPNGYAGYFEGNVAVVGNFTVLYGTKSAAVRHPDGSHRLLYSMESPECWFEDFGTGKLVRGRAKVKLDRDFTAIVRTGSYHVFLAPEGDSQGLFVSSRNSTGFEVGEQQKGKSSVRFSYRVVAKRKDVAGPRLPKVKVKLPNLDKLRKPSKSLGTGR
jgi:hypothetical protein